MPEIYDAATISERKNALSKYGHMITHSKSNFAGDSFSLKPNYKTSSQRKNREGFPTARFFIMREDGTFDVKAGKHKSHIHGGKRKTMKRKSRKVHGKHKKGTRRH